MCTGNNHINLNFVKKKNKKNEPIKQGKQYKFVNVW